MRFLYYAACFLAAAVLASFPHFLAEAHRAFPVVDRAILLGLAIGVAWFFAHTVHENWKWSVLSSIFVLETISAVVFAILLFLQLWSGAFAWFTLVLVLVHAAVLSYLLSHRLPHLRGLVFFTVLFFLIAGELVITFGTSFV